WVYVRASNPNGGVAGTERDEQYPIRRSSLIGPDPQGKRVCMSGANGTSCGKVMKVDVTWTDDDGFTTKRLAWTNYCARQGDSGAPVYAYGSAYGIHSGSSHRTA